MVRYLSDAYGSIVTYIVLVLSAANTRLGIWRDTYRFDPLFRTEANIIGLHLAFAAVVLIIVGTSFGTGGPALRNDIDAGLASSVASRDPAVIAESVVSAIGQGRTERFFINIALIIGATLIFTFIIVRASLTPARNALSAQKQFIGNIAHELRTPLAVIKTNTEVALLDDLPSELRIALKDNVSELDRASEILNNLLSLSTLLRPEHMQFSAVDLSESVGKAAETYRGMARRGEIHMTVRTSPGVMVLGNTTALQQIAANLIKNAIQYTPKKGEIDVTVAPAEENRIQLSVQDNGIGIARDDPFRIFEPFYRSDPSRNRSQGGSGLGLAIVSELVKLHHGKITIRSAPKKGTTVIVLLPAAPRSRASDEVRAKHQISEIAADFSKRAA